jgi:hypothetical protein
VFKTFRRMPFLKWLALAQVALLLRNHFQRLTPAERQRLSDLVRHGTGLSPAEKAELKSLVTKLEPAAFATRAADHLSPFPLPGRFGGRR